jgi:uncharacterized protein (TIGR01777 family)
MSVFLHASRMPVDPDALSRWHFRAGALDRLLPPFQQARVISSHGSMAEGSRAELAVRIGPVWVRWKAIHEAVEPGRGFRDRQLSGPFAAWVHDHRFLPAGESESVLEDRIEYALKFGALGRLLGGATVRRDLARLFAFRHRRTREDLRRHGRFAGPPMHLAISGASGLVGRNLRAFLSTGGHQVRSLVRRDPNAAQGEIAWDPAAGRIDAAALDGLDAVVHLAGAGIADRRWTPARMDLIRASRVDSTRLLAETLAGLPRPPKVLVSASAVGWYGSRSGEPLDESAPAGRGFLAEVAHAWEAATEPAERAGIRVVHLRIGVVVTGQGGILAKLRTPFALGLGGPVGDGRQAMPWIALDDLLGVVLAALRDETLSGPVNAVSPNLVDNRGFGRALGRVLRRPAIAPLPAFMVKALFGRMGTELLLGGAPVAPARLLERRFEFLHGDLEDALRFELGRQRPEGHVEAPR